MKPTVGTQLAASCLLIIFSFDNARAVRYDGFQVVQVAAETRDQLHFINSLRKDGQVIFWQDPREVGLAEILVAPTAIVALLDRLQEAKIVNKITESNFQSELDRLSNRTRGYDRDDFNRFEDILDELDRLVTLCPSGFTCATDDIGQTDQARPLRLIKITQQQQQQEESGAADRKSLWLDSLIHAREWIAGTTVMRIVDKLIGEYPTDDDVKHVLDNYDVYVLPVHNPDGYHFSWQQDRLWRKTRASIPDSECVGIDLNRNFDAKWGSSGASDSPCSDIFHGSSAGSELETQAVQAAVTDLAANLMAFVTVHTQASAWLRPYGFYEDGTTSCAEPDDQEDLQAVTDAATAAIEDTFNTTWRRGNSCRILYVTSGTSQDWAKYSAGIKYSFTPELRGPGFNPGVGAIEPAYQETWNGFVAMLRQIEQIESFR